MSKTVQHIFNEVGYFIHSFKNFFIAPPASNYLPNPSKSHYPQNNLLSPSVLKDKNLFRQASKLIQIDGGGTSRRQQGGGVCVKVCSFDGGLVRQHLARMGDTLTVVHRSLMTVEYCLVILTFVCSLAIFIGAFMGFVWLIRAFWRHCRKARNVGNSKWNGYPPCHGSQMASSKEDGQNRHQLGWPSKVISNEYAEFSPPSSMSTLQRRCSSKSTMVMEVEEEEEEYDIAIGDAEVANDSISFQRRNLPSPPPRPPPRASMDKLKIHQGDD